RECGGGAGLRIFTMRRGGAAGKSLGLLPGGLAGLFIFFDLDLKLGASLHEVLLFFAGLLESGLQLPFFIAQSAPRLKDTPKRMGCKVLLVWVHSGAGGRRVVTDGLVLFLQALDLGLGIATSLFQVFGGIVQFVLVKLHLRLGDVDLVLQVIFLRLGSSGQLSRQGVDAVLIVFDGLLGVRLAGEDFFGLGR